MMKRMYHSWDKWEDYKYGFYDGKIKSKENMINNCKGLFQNLNLFEECLKTIILNWKFSCEHNLSNPGLNKVAYLGQAACALKFEAPNSVSRIGYNILSEKEKNEADKLAMNYLKKWESKYEFIEKI